MGIGQQQPIRDTVDEVCTAVNSFIYDIIAANQKDDACKLLSLALKVRKFLLNANLGGFVNALRKYITGELIDKFIEQLIEEYTTEEQRKAFIKEVCEIVLDSLPTFNIEERFFRILNKKYDTEEHRNKFLHLAAEQGNLDAAKYFVEKGADISAKTNGDDTPLYKAAFVVEMQLARDKGFEKRAQAYAGKVYSRQSGRYTNLKKVFFIAISNCILFPKKSNYISSHTIRDEETNEHDLQCLSLKH